MAQLALSQLALLPPLPSVCCSAATLSRVCLQLARASHRIASHRIASHRIASHIASHRIAYRIASHRIASLRRSASRGCGTRARSSVDCFAYAAASELCWFSLMQLGGWLFCRCCSFELRWFSLLQLRASLVWLNAAPELRWFSLLQLGGWLFCRCCSFELLRFSLLQLRGFVGLVYCSYGASLV